MTPWRGAGGRWHYLNIGATLALATGRFTEAARLAREGFKVFSDMGHPAAIGGLAVILSQAALHVGLDRSGLAEAFGLVPAQLRPEAVDTTQGVATIFPAFQAAGMAADVPANTEFTEYEAGELYIR